jgi:DNA-directed RNA polymerase subunit RPC12/RpoP
MPIRFRCFYCNQLMGIARRKAGTTVRCPTCSSQVVVPQRDDEGTDRAGGEVPEAPLFERNDFDRIFQEAAAAGNRPPPPLPPAQERLEPVPLKKEETGVRTEYTPPPPPAGPVLSRGAVTALCVGAIVGLALAFAAGLVVGKYFL